MKPPDERPLALAREGGPVAQARAALIQLRSGETLEQAYEAWDALRAQRAAAEAAHAGQAKSLKEQGEFLLGTVRAAGGASSSVYALAPLEGFLGNAQSQLATAGEELARATEQSREAFASAEAEIRNEVFARVERYRQRVRPKLKLHRRSVGADRTILHVERVSADESILLLSLALEAIPSRYAFLFDDSTDDALKGPTSLYPDGVSQTRPDAMELRALLSGDHRVLPVKGSIPLWVPNPQGGRELFRMLSRGPVMEVERAEGTSFVNVLSRDEAERFAGQLLRLRLEGKLELELALS